MTMERYIDANAIPYSNGIIYGRLLVDKRTVDVLPTIDAVAVVRCKDCESWDEERKVGRASFGNETAPCSEWSNAEDGHTRYTSPNDFCSYGERRDSDG